MLARLQLYTKTDTLLLEVHSETSEHISGQHASTTPQPHEI